jgi:chemotaxis response regulator CheB
MPRSAVETGHVDHLMPAIEIAKALSALAHEPLQDAKKPNNAGLKA